MSSSDMVRGILEKIPHVHRSQREAAEAFVREVDRVKYRAIRDLMLKHSTKFSNPNSVAIVNLIVLAGFYMQLKPALPKADRLFNVVESIKWEMESRIDPTIPLNIAYSIMAEQYQKTVKLQRFAVPHKALRVKRNLGF